MEEMFGWFIATSEDARLITDGEQVSVLYDGKVIGAVEFAPKGYVIDAADCRVIVNPDKNTIEILPPTMMIR